ncbi:hypothetical protein N7457_002196 [Penicillium paradoxum]|uniref:uncharacterized protein n=1 Tax=Penicillium paradoxum TaxID=176176 RepID=UPI0025490B82|nr:uncharacterized protein N7457_002196 [Penicillium paradoxum]KAJ5787206.1 hypothetical protein N7457_002196 [Penicillium paradoxum]
MRLSAALYSPTHPWLACLKSAQLQRIARATGIQSSGTKGVLTERIAAELALQLQSDCVADGIGISSSSTRSSQDRHESSRLRGSRNISKTEAEEPRSDATWSILSIDMGVQNLAFAHLIVPRLSDAVDVENLPIPKLTAWHRLAVSEISSLNLIPGDGNGVTHVEVELGSGDGSDASKEIIPITGDTGSKLLAKAAKSTTKEKESFSPDLYAANAYTLISSLLAAYRPTHVLIERQRFRSGGGSAVQEWTLRVGVLEGMFHAVLHTLRQERGGDIADLMVRGVEPKRVVRYWLENGTSAAAKETEPKAKEKRPSAQEVKKAKINLVGGWLSTAMQAVDTPSDMDASSRRLVSGIAGEKKIELADKSECPVLHRVASAYMQKWQGKRQTIKGKGDRASKSSSSLQPSSSRSALEDEVAAVDLGKLDDLADCLLQGVTWVEWQIMRKRIAREGIEALDPMP